MMKVVLPKVLILSMAICLVNFLCFAQKKNFKTSPNIIIVLADDLGYNDVSFNGSTEIPTPNIDRIANNGVKFTNGYVSYAVCGPSRAGLITGRYQGRFGFSRNPLFAPNDPNQGLPLSEETMASTLGRAGYKSLALGKWHLGAHESQRPLKRGFTEFYGFLTGGHYYFPEDLTLNDISEIESQYAAYRTKLLRNDSRVDEKEYLTDAFSREAVDFIGRNKDNPFFIYLAYNAPHTPLQATEKYLSRFDHITDKKRKTYAAMVNAVDDGVGRVLDKLEELGISENTLVFFLSDNGGPEPHNASDNGALRGTKGSLWEGGIRVPFAVQWPGTIPASQVYDHPIISLDIFATAAELANVKPKNKLDGVNLVPYLTGKEKGEPHKSLEWRMYDRKAYAIRKGDYKLVNVDGEKEMLFNITNDIGESTPLEEGKTAIAMLKSFNNWLSMLMDPVFLGLKDDSKYNELHPDRFDLEKY
ncbi:sulfatase-like hydrolase/transferase [Echinicola shivajiensis]|uniref:sulfatase-like hydrolase/transferase n=1 Tax=Echinicola shivajiensis TaxID=1035916 RepID=UPI001FE6E3BA|nr:sulfatase-like hydrolase/transferase [Echinicola shivajiensis]